MIISFEPFPAAAQGDPCTTVVRAGEWTIAILRLEGAAGRSNARWVIADAFGYLAGDEGLAFATLFHARCWFICRLAQSGQTLLRGQVAEKPARRGGEARAIH
ncbi:hypothetical protein ACMGDM_00910 [Sphingomonas sp. DT-51]|uniref:hypothetical protein n=1 Tax=Sphingomonas sp. DT-51 TaxID=3396165 RepID=UPI003F1DBD52